MANGMRIALVLVLAVLGLDTGLAAQDETADPARAGEYAGSAQCIECHGPQHRRLERSPHAAVLAAEGLRGCETCHGPGLEHQTHPEQDPGLVTMPAKLTLRQQETACAICHRDAIAAHGGDLRGMQHAGKACSDCHEIHRAKPSAPPPQSARTRLELDRTNQPVGSEVCTSCHPFRDALLVHGGHAGLASERAADGCERCHGNGEQHVATNGRAFAITRPDRAEDGIATCRACHADVDARTFHWRDGVPAHLAASLSCASCHRVHQDPFAAEVDPAASPATNRTCAQCHVPVACTMPGSAHAALGALDLPLSDGCGACHAGGEAHARRSGARALVSRQGGENAIQQAESCLRCHGDEPSLARVRHGVHVRAEVACTDCHGPLHGAAANATERKAEAACARCHPAVAAEFRLPNHHPVPEGRMGCSSCHDPHGQRIRVRDLDLRERSCATCHPRYAGPFVFAHQAGRRDGCVVCHVPHGSPNRRMLQQANAQQNCTSCHGDFPAFHDQTPGAVFTDCLRCHTEVHGSNHSRLLFR